MSMDLSSPATKSMGEKQAAAGRTIDSQKELLLVSQELMSLRGRNGVNKT